MGLLTINALTAADSVIIPIQSEYYALEGLSQLMNTISLVRQHLNRSLKVEGVALTMYDGRSLISKQIAAEIKKYFTKSSMRSSSRAMCALRRPPATASPSCCTIPNARARVPMRRSPKNLS